MNVRNSIGLIVLTTVAWVQAEKITYGKLQVNHVTTPCPKNLKAALDNAKSYLAQHRIVSGSKVTQALSYLGGTPKDIKKNWQAMVDFINNGKTGRNTTAVSSFINLLNKAGYSQYKTNVCVSYSDATGIIRYQTPQQYLQAIVNHLEN